MLTKDVSAEIEQVMQSLHDSGKQPTIALVKSRLSTNVPMPAIIAVIKSWKSNQSIPKIEVADTAQSLEDKVLILEKKIEELTQRLDKLEVTK